MASYPLLLIREALPTADAQFSTVMHESFQPPSSTRKVQVSKRVRATNIAELSPWMKGPVSTLCDGLPVLEENRENPAKPLANWRAWMIELGDPIYWKPDAPWPSFFANLKAARSWLCYRRENYELARKFLMHDLVRSIADEAFVRYKKTCENTSGGDKFPARWGPDDRNTKSLRTLVALAEKLHEYIEHHKYTVPTAMARVGIYPDRNPVGQIDLAIHQIYADVISTAASSAFPDPRDRQVKGLKKLVDFLSRELGGCGIIPLSAGPAPGNPFASSFWIESVHRLCSGLPKPRRFSSSGAVFFGNRTLDHSSV
jgi:hypothetical protein